MAQTGNKDSPHHRTVELLFYDLKRNMWLLPPALLRMLLPLVVELQGDLGIEADAEVVVHHTLLHVALSKVEEQAHKHSQLTEKTAVEEDMMGGDTTVLTGSLGRGR